jgi:hypothetical protein
VQNETRVVAGSTVLRGMVRGTYMLINVHWVLSRSLLIEMLITVSPHVSVFTSVAGEVFRYSLTNVYVILCHDIRYQCIYCYNL